MVDVLVKRKIKEETLCSTMFRSLAFSLAFCARKVLTGSETRQREVKIIDERTKRKPLINKENPRNPLDSGDF